MTTPNYPLRPFMPSDTVALADLFAQSIEELTADDYDDEQRLAWIATAADAEEFAERLEHMLTLVIQVDGEYLGFASLKKGTVLDMLYVHPYAVGKGVGSTLVDALERLAAARGAKEITTDASDTARKFFEKRGYVALHRNSLPLADQWLTNTTMKKELTPAKDAADTKS